jgi:hypothetical protein
MEKPVYSHHCRARALLTWLDATFTWADYRFFLLYSMLTLPTSELILLVGMLLLLLLPGTVLRPNTWKRNK